MPSFGTTAVTALIAWPRFHSARAEPQGAKQMAAPAEATVATQREEKNLVQRKNKRTDLTPTGLLMEGDLTQNPCRGILSVIAMSHQLPAAPASLIECLPLGNRRWRQSLPRNLEGN
jgi:hypothetical protein